MKTIPRHAFREYDIRGVADVDLSDDLVESIGRHYTRQLLRERAGSAGSAKAETARPLTIAVARDGRHSSERLFRALTKGMTEAGADVEAVGIGPTPMLYFAAHHLHTDGACMITGSHNPAPDNGFKLMRGKASFFGPDIQRLAEAIEKDESETASRQGEIRQHDLADAYVEKVRSSSKLSGTDVKFVVDAGNGAAGPLGLATLEALGFSPDPLYCDIDGDFPNHHPDPTVEDNLVDLKARVLETGATLGIAWDGDGDRIGAIDDRGDVVWGDKLMILFSRAVLAEHPGATILGEVKCSQTMYDDIEAHGGRGVFSKTGHSLIKTKMKQDGALLAGEMSGHIFFADRYPGYDDGIYAAVRLLEIIAKEGRGLRELLSDVPKTYATPEIRFECADAIKFDVVDAVRERYRATHPVLEIDGARIDFGDGAWGLCRASNTQAVLVLRFEALSEARRDEIRAEVEGAVEEARTKILAAAEGT